MENRKRKVSQDVTQVILTKLGFHTFRYSENEILSERQNMIFREGLILTVLCWYDVMTSLGVEPLRNLRSVLNNLTEMSVVEIVSILKSSDSILTRTVKDVPEFTSSHFKDEVRIVNRKAGQILGLFSRAIVGWFDNEDQHCFDALHTSFSFLTRINLPDLVSLRKAAMTEYLEHEEYLRRLDENDDENNHLYQVEAKLMQTWFPRSDFANIFAEFEGRHGSGSVAEELDEYNIFQKYQHMTTDVTLEHFAGRLVHRDLQGDVINPGVLPLGYCKASLSRVARVVFVPKSTDKLRTISMEPISLQWYQQGIARAIRRWIERSDHPLKRRVNLGDQERSRELAQIGSLDGYYATIDLSNASDSVRWTSVKKWFNKTALILALHCSRSRSVIIGSRKQNKGKIIKIRKFAPMGSALCFPVECITFCAIVEAAILEANGDVDASNYCIYGDDIIVEDMYAHAVIQRLTQYGFQVNTKKTFTGQGSHHNFRESCGCDSLDGLIVSPVRISRKFDGFRFHWNYSDGIYWRDEKNLPSQVSRLIDMCNECYTRLPFVRNFLISQLNLQLKRYERPLFNDTGDGGIYSPESTNHHLEAPRWNNHTNDIRIPDYQRLEIKHGRIHPKKGGRSDDPAFEVVRYYEYLRSVRHRRSFLNPEDLVEVDISSLRDDNEWRVVYSFVDRVSEKYLCNISRKIRD